MHTVWLVPAMVRPAHHEAGVLKLARFGQYPLFGNLAARLITGRLFRASESRSRQALGKPSHGQLGAPLQLHRRLHRLDALVSRSDGLRERGLEALIGRDLRVLLIGHAYRRLQ